MKLTDKQSIVEELHSRLKGSEIAILVQFAGLDVATVTKLRRDLREAGVEFQVVKNTLLTRASEETDVAIIKDHFKGPNAIAISQEDPVAPAKILSKFAEDFPKLEIKIGVLNGKVIDPAGIKALADLPSREVLLAQLLSAMNGVPTALVRVLNAVPQDFMNVLGAIKDEKGAA